MVYRILVSSYTSEIYTLLFDPAVPSLTLESTLTVGHHPSWITFYPGDHTLVFTGLEQSDGKVIALKYDESGKGRVVAEASSGGADPCSLLATADELWAANYSGGTIGIHPISPNPPYFVSSAPKTVISLPGAGPNKDRQEASHPHQVVLHEEYQEILVPDLGADRVIRFKKAAGGSWEIYGHIGYTPGGGPRHIEFFGSELYTVLELTSKVAQHRLPGPPLLPSLVTTTATMSKPLPVPNDMLAAEILVARPNILYPTPYLFVSNRNDPSPEGDIISVFQLPTASKQGPIQLVNEVPTGLNHVRGILFGGTDDKWLIAGGVNGGGVKIYERVEGGKGLRFVVGNEDLKSPTGFLWL